MARFVSGMPRISLTDTVYSQLAHCQDHHHSRRPKRSELPASRRGSRSVASLSLPQVCMSVSQDVDAAQDCVAR